VTLPEVEVNKKPVSKHVQKPKLEKKKQVFFKHTLQQKYVSSLHCRVRGDTWHSPLQPSAARIHFGSLVSLPGSGIFILVAKCKPLLLAQEHKCQALESVSLDFHGNTENSKIRQKWPYSFGFPKCDPLEKHTFRGPHRFCGA